MHAAESVSLVRRLDPAYASSETDWTVTFPRATALKPDLVSVDKKPRRSPFGSMIGRFPAKVNSIKLLSSASVGPEIVPLPIRSPARKLHPFTVRWPKLKLSTVVVFPANFAVVSAPELMMVRGEAGCKLVTANDSERKWLWVIFLFISHNTQPVSAFHA